MRLFVALDIPEQVCEALRALVERLRMASGTVKWSRIENTHLTLKFIGEAPVEKLQKIKSALAVIPRPIRMIFRGVGFFPNPKRPRVFWAGVEAGPELARLAESVSTSLEPLGIEKERRAFSPHVTLAQFKVTNTVKQLQRAISDAGSLDFGETVTTEFHLYQSVLKPTGAEYTRLATYRFAEGGPR
jgi:2'-5' RNA ligase